MRLAPLTSASAAKTVNGPVQGDSVRGSFHILLLFLLVTGLAFAEASDSPKLSPEERTFTASKVYSLVRGYFFSANGLQTPGLDVSYKTYLRTALTSDDRRQFDLATIEFVSQLHDGHTFFWDTCSCAQEQTQNES